MKTPYVRIILISAFFLTFAPTIWSQSSGRPEYVNNDITNWNAVYPLGRFGYAGCGFSLPRKLIVRDTTEPNFSITFEGGKRAGGVYATNQCFGFSGYVAKKYLDYPSHPTQLSDKITATFSRPLTVQTIRLKTKTPASYRITLNDSISRNYIVPPREFYEDIYPYKLIYLTSIGFTTENIENVTKISIQSLETEDWSFAIDSIGFEDVASGGSGGGNGDDPPSFNNPVIFIPGVAGSELFEHNVGPRWLPLSITDIGSALDALILPSDRDIYATDMFRGQSYLSGQFEANYYQDLRAFFRTEYGRDSLYEVAGMRERRTTTGCDMSQDSTNPNEKPKIFVLAYDWRKSNVETAAALDNYVGCVKRFYPDKKIDLVAHSMGGLVARRYVLDNPDDHEVEKLVTIGTPFLGAPKSIHALETGVFIAPAFGGDKGKWAANWFLASKLKSIIETFPGALQLLPSGYYFDLHYSDLNSEIFPYPFSIRANPFSDFEDYNYSETIDWLNENHEIRPGDITDAFHQTSHQGLQDDWRNDTSNINYFHIYGQQKSNLTVGKVRVLQNTVCNPMSLNCFYTTYYEPIPTNGDGTVPMLSSRRISYSQNINLRKAKRYIADARTSSGQFDNTTEHNALTANENVHATLLKILKDEDSFAILQEDDESPIVPNPLTAKASSFPENEASSLYVSLHNVQGANVNRSFQPTVWGAAGVNGMQAIPMGENSAWYAMPANDSYKVSFFGDGTPIKVQIVKGLDYDRVEKTVAYIDLIIPADTVAELDLSPFNDPLLFYDSNGDDFPDTFVSPTITITGNNAKDLEPPVVSFDVQPNGADRIITLSATDNLSGVRKIYYSLDGVQFNEYENPGVRLRFTFLPKIIISTEQALLQSILSATLTLSATGFGLI